MPAVVPHTGWGDDSLTVTQNLIIEQDKQAEVPVICGAADAETRVMVPQIEAAIRRRFKFDSGWSFTVAEELYYKELLWFLQNIGNCVGASHVELIGSTIAHEVVVLGQPEIGLGKGQLAMPFTPYSYGVGRLAGGMLGGGDGSYCGAQIKGTMEYGFLPCDTPGLEKFAGSGASDLPQGTESAGRLFGKSKKELETWMPYAQPFDLQSAPKPRDADEAYDLIANKQIALQICSGVMPTYWKRDPVFGDLYRMGERASHSTQLIAAFEYKGERFVVDRNQWGKTYHKGSDVFNFRGDCMVFPLDELAKWYRQGVEVMGIGGIQGRPDSGET